MIEASALPGHHACFCVGWRVLGVGHAKSRLEACNYDPTAHVLDEDKCILQDECGVCNGPGAIYDCGCADIPEGDCDCEGNVVDALGACGGTCAADEDGDGICDDGDACVGEADECGVCNGPGAIYGCGCSDVPEGACDCAGNVEDILGVCGGGCTADEDGDGICDDEDDCVGESTAAACGGVLGCGCNDIPTTAIASWTLWALAAHAKAQRRRHLRRRQHPRLHLRHRLQLASINDGSCDSPRATAAWISRPATTALKRPSTMGGVCMLLRLRLTA